MALAEEGVAMCIVHSRMGGVDPTSLTASIIWNFCIGGWSLFSHYTIFPCKILPVFCMLKILYSETRGPMHEIHAGGEGGVGRLQPGQHPLAIRDSLLLTARLLVPNCPSAHSLPLGSQSLALPRRLERLPPLPRPVFWLSGASAVRTH